MLNHILEVGILRLPKDQSACSGLARWQWGQIKIDIRENIIFNWRFSEKLEPAGAASPTSPHLLRRLLTGYNSRSTLDFQYFW